MRVRAASMALGIVYSVNLPGMRWKRSPILAAGCILVIRAFVVQFCFYLHSTVYVLHKCVRASARACVRACAAMGHRLTQSRQGAGAARLPYLRHRHDVPLLRRHRLL